LTINDKWSISNELHVRNNDFLHTTSQFLERPSIDFHIGNDMEASVGYTFIRSTPVIGNAKTFYRNENNLWTQLFFNSKMGRFRFQHRLRQEYRWVDHVTSSNDSFVIDEVDYLQRFRYRFVAMVDLFQIGDRPIFLNAFDEVWVNQDASFRFTSFARNWLYIGLGCRIKSDEVIQLGYISQRDQMTGNRYSQTPILQASFIRNFKLARKVK
jgi:hypothetical protein